MDTQIQDDISCLQEQVKDLRERVEKLENPEFPGNKDFNNKLSNDAQKLIQDSKGPLKPEELLKHLTDDSFAKYKKETLTVMRKYPNNVDGVKNQFSHVLENVENRVARRKMENILDDKLIKKVRKFIKMVEEEEKEMKEKDEKPKIQSTMDQFFESKSLNVSSKNNEMCSKLETANRSNVGKENNPAKQAEKGRKKRKARTDDEDYESCSSQEVEVDQVTAKFNKRLKLNSSHESNIELNSQNPTAEESAKFNQYREPSPIVSSEGSQSSLGSPIQSDEIAENDSAEIFPKTKTVMKATVKRSKQNKSRDKENVPEYSKNEETVNEKQLPLKRKPLR